MAMPFRRSNPRRAVNLNRHQSHRVLRRWVPNGIQIFTYDLGDANFHITLDMTAEYPDVDPSANFDLSLLFAGDIGVTQFFGRLLEESRAPYNPPSEESRA
jgi:hypothetical protein